MFTELRMLHLHVYNLKKLIYTSSVATLNTASLSDGSTKVDINEMIGDYKKSKYLAEKIVKKLTNKNLQAIIVNPSTL